MANRLKQLKKELGFHEYPGLVYGYFSGFLVSFSQQDKELELFVDAELEEDDTAVLEKLRVFLQSNAHAYNIEHSSLSNTGVSVIVSEKNHEGLLEFFYIFMNQLKMLKIPGSGFCSNCGNAIDEDAHVAVKIGNHAHTCDETCAKKIVSSKKAASANRTRRHVLAGVLGALFIGLISCAPYILLGQAGLYCAYAAFLIPVAVGFGYYLFGGKPGAGKLLSCLILPLLLFALAAIGLLSLSLYQSWATSGYAFNAALLFQTLRDALQNNADLRAAFLQQQLLYGFIFLIAGYVFTLPTAYERRERYFALLPDVRDHE